jgi:solute carrier family 26 (sodium-independent sulfate anion transporter), member 11
MTITLFNSIENGVYAMIALSLMVLLFRTFQANGSFLGSVTIRTMSSVSSGNQSPDPKSKEKLDEVHYQERLGHEGRRVFLPLDRNDGSNPRVQLEAPDPGIFIYRLKEGFNYTNCYKQLDDIAAVVKQSTRRGQPPNFEKPGVSCSKSLSSLLTI